MRPVGRQDKGRMTALHKAEATLILFNNYDTNEYQWRIFLRKADFRNRGTQDLDISRPGKVRFCF